MPNRKIAPPIQQIEHLQLPQPEVIYLDNNIPVYLIEAGTQEIVKMEIIAQAGRWYEAQPLVSRATAALLKEGTTTHTGAVIAETVDFYGASLSFPINLDTSNIVLYALSKHFERLLPFVLDILTAPAFLPAEFEKFVKRSRRRLMLDLEQNDVVAYRQFTEAIFGTDHPYGYNSTDAMYAELDLMEIKKHFNDHYRAGNYTVILSGRPNANCLELLNRYLGRNLPLGKSITKTVGLSPNPNRSLNYPRPKSHQASIKIGRRLFNRHHPDFQAVNILNTVLGGYFGARLMTNLREEKGYTYGVYSTFEPMTHDGYFYVSTEVGRGAVKGALKEIYREFKRLQTEPISQKELQMVRSYLLGNLLNLIDGPFNIAEVVKTHLTENLDWRYFDQTVEAIKTTPPEALLALAQTYLNFDEMCEVIVG